MLEKAKPRSLYVCRYVKNAKDIIAWAKQEGFDTTLPAKEMHVTIIHSKKPVDWMKVDASEPGLLPQKELVVGPGGPRLVEPLGDKGAVVLLFNDNNLTWRNKAMREAGAAWDYDGYQPHVTISWDAADVDLDQVEPYTGEIVLGPEIFTEVDDSWSDKVTEKALAKLHKVGARHSRVDQDMLQTIHDHAVNLGAHCQEMAKQDLDITLLKVDKGLGLVFGWAIICKQNGQDYYDLNIDKGGEKVPEHIPEATMLECAADFMENSRVAKEMHGDDPKGSVVFAFPLTTDIAKAMVINAHTTGLMVAMKPSPELLKRFVSGELKGFSIGGSKLKFEDVEDEK